MPTADAPPRGSLNTFRPKNIICRTKARIERTDLPLKSFQFLTLFIEKGVWPRGDSRSLPFHINIVKPNSAGCLARKSAVTKHISLIDKLLAIIRNFSRL